MNPNTHNVTLYGAQSELWDAFLNSKKHIMAVVPVGSGKSFLCQLLLPIVANTPEMHMGRDVCYVAPTNPMVERIIWSPLKKMCMEQYGLSDEKDINNSKKTITFQNGIKINCLSAETGLKGMNASLIICDEAAEFSEEALQELSNRIRPAVGSPESTGRLICVSTPEGKNAFHTMYENALLHPEEWIVFHFTYKQMRSQSKKWIQEQKYLLSPLKFAKDMMCDWGSVVDQFFYTWKPHMIVETTVDRQGDLYSFHDFNKKCMTAVIAQLVGNMCSPTGRIEVLKSYAIQDCSTEELAIRIRQDFPQRNIKTIMDRSGSHVNRDTTSAFGITDQTILEKYGFRMINTANSNPLISDTDNSSNAFIQQGRLVIPEYEKQLIDAMETYHYEDGSRKQLVKYKEAKYMHLDGLGDCIRYGIHFLFPMQHTIDQTMPEYIDSDHSLYEEPGAEYMTQSEAKSNNGVPTIKELLKHFNPDADSEYWG